MSGFILLPTLKLGRRVAHKAPANIQSEAKWVKSGVELVRAPRSTRCDDDDENDDIDDDSTFSILLSGLSCILEMFIYGWRGSGLRGRTT